MRDHDSRRPPELGQLYFEQPIELSRGYRVVGLEETSDPSVWWLLMERMNWRKWLEEADVNEGLVHGFTRDPPKPRLRAV